MKLKTINESSYMAAPHPVLASLLAAGPVADVKLPIVGRTKFAVSHEAVMDVLKDQERFAVNATNAGKKSAMGMWLPKSLRLMTENMLLHDEPDHRRLRKLADAPFHARAIEDQRPAVTEAADRLLDELQREDTPDLLSGYCARLPLIVICDILGIDDTDRDRFAAWLKTMGGKTNMMMVLRFMPQLKKITAYLRGEIAARRVDPRPGMITELVQAEADGEKLSENELIAMILMLFVAGHETTTHMLSTSILTLLAHPEQLEELQSDWAEKAPRAVEELIRYNSPVQMTKPRHARHDMQFHGVEMKQGQRIMAFLAGANADPSQFPDPATFDITRENVRHTGFGGGIHLCLGIQLARTEGQVALERLFTRFPALSLGVPASELKWMQRMGMRGVEALPVKLQPALARVA